MNIPQGHVPALVVRPADKEGHLANAAQALISGDQDPTPFVRAYSEPSSNLIIDPSFAPIAMGDGSTADVAPHANVVLEPKKAKRFLVSGFVSAGRDGAPAQLDRDPDAPVYSNPRIGELLAPCPPTCGTSRYVGTAADVATQLGAPALHGRGLDGTGVGLAIVDSGIYVPRITKLLGHMRPSAPPMLNATHSWKPSRLVTRPGQHRVGHGTMCAYDALIVAPKATLLDFPMLLARQTGDHHSTGTVAAAIQAYLRLLVIKPSFNALVVSNSWGIFHPSLEDFQPGHPWRFIDNPIHVFGLFTRLLALAGADVIFCGNNCGDGTNCAGDCASGTCLSKTDRMIMGANAYQDVLTIGGCDTYDQVVGYSSRGPSIANMFQEKPDLVAYTHFLGSKTNRTWVPDTGVSAACPVAAGCVAALRTKIKPSAVPPGQLFRTLRATARKPAPIPSGWDPAYGHGIINPVAAGRALGLSIP